MKKLTALLLAGSLSLTLFGCKDKAETGINKEEQKAEDDGLVSVWLLTSETDYEADGSKGGNQWIYTYTENGMPLTAYYDRGPQRQYWDEELKIYITAWDLPYDGKPENIREYFYNAQGDYLYREDQIKEYNVDGEMIHSSETAEGKGYNYTYHRDDQGRIERVDYYYANNDNTSSGKLFATMHYCYDIKGNLVEVYSEGAETGNISWCYDFRYNERGQLITSATHIREGMYIYTYEYDGQGHLTSISHYYREDSQVPLDDQCVSEATIKINDASEPTLKGKETFTYDSAGRLLSRSGMNETRTYDSDGRLKTVTYSEGNVILFVDSEDEITDGYDCYGIRDEHGNVVKVIGTDGSYTEYTYQEFRLTAEEAERCKRVRLANKKKDPSGMSAYAWIPFNPGIDLAAYIPIPGTDFDDYK